MGSGYEKGNPNGPGDMLKEGFFFNHQKLGIEKAAKLRKSRHMYQINVYLEFSQIYQVSHLIYL